MAIIKGRRPLKGVRVPHCKNTEQMESVLLNDVHEVVLPMVQHMGAPCVPTVKPGDLVRLGDKIGDSEEFFSAPIHASCSGRVLRIEDFRTATGVQTKAVVLENDGAGTPGEAVQKPVVNSREDFIRAVRESGAVGLGGAGFPVHVKLAYKDPDRIHTLVINAAECEPYITSDYRECLENSDAVLRGIRAVQKYLEIPKVCFGIEANKPAALRLWDEKTADDPQFSVVRLRTRYPQGAEKAIIYATTGIRVQAGKLPADCGVIVMNVSSAGFLGNYLETGMPLVSKRITVDGDCVKKPQNLIVPLGTPVRRVLEYCGADLGCEKLLMGGPMMGTPLGTADTPVIKNNNAILAFSKNAVHGRDTTACIRCGRCVAACPMGLMPAAMEKAYDRKDADTLARLQVGLCINCGCCSYVCPARRQLAQKHQLAKALVRGRAKKS